jgi:3-oxoacyl-[acyl-carrier protein] reductase
MSLEGKACVITGAAAGIGTAVAERFAQLGATIAAWDVDRDGAQALADRLGG